MEWLPPRTMETVGFVMPAISSAMARPASTSPPTVFSRKRTPFTSSLSSSLASRGSTCSYLVVLAPLAAVLWPSIWPMMVMQYTEPWGVLVRAEPKSTICWAPSFPLSSFSSVVSAGLVRSVMVNPPFPRYSLQFYEKYALDFLFAGYCDMIKYLKYLIFYSGPSQ